MRHKVPRQLGSLKRRKGKSSSETKSSSKASATKRKDIKRPKTDSAAGLQQRNSACGYGKPAVPLERFSRITCECHQLPDRRRCSASPRLEKEEGKENEVRMRLELDGCRAYGFLDVGETEHMDYASSGKSIFPDDDSNQILPVEQFFGNLDTVQDFPQRSATTSTWVHRQSRRRHFYAKEDSDEEEAGLSDMQQDVRGGS